MAFSNIVTESGILPGGRAYERGTWDGAAVTTGTITSAASGNGLPKLARIDEFSFGSDGDTDVLPAQDVNPDQIKITFTTSDTGTYYIEGQAA